MSQYFPWNMSWTSTPPAQQQTEYTEEVQVMLAKDLMSSYSSMIAAGISICLIDGAENTLVITDAPTIDPNQPHQICIPTEHGTLNVPANRQMTVYIEKPLPGASPTSHP